MRITRTHLAMTAIAGLALVTGALIGGPSPSSALQQPRPIDLTLANARHVAHIDVQHRSRSAGRLCARGPVCLGDSFIATDVPLRDAQTRRRVGRADALETVFGRQGEYWTITARLADGTLQVYGQRRHPKRVSVLPVVGGTGAYAGARGTMRFADIGETGRARLTFNLGA
jgi:Dirigent-like protein